MRRIVTVIATLALVACGTTTANPGQPTESTTTLPLATTTIGEPATTTTDRAETTTTTLSPSTTSTAAAPSTSAAARTVTVAPYFYLDEVGHKSRGGPFVFPMSREVPHTVAVARAAIEQLLAGPTSGERESVPAISTAIPDGVRLLGLTISEDIAVIDFSKEFEATDDSAAVATRAAQVVFTLSRFDSVAEVLFRQEGKPVKIQTGDGNLVDRPVGIWDYLEFAAAITVESPAYNGVGDNPLHVTGFAAVFEAVFHYALADDDGLIIDEGMVMTTNGTGWGGFDFTIDYEVDKRQVGALIVWTHSAEDGERIDIREYPVVLTP
jgi:hypothetical protein